MLYGTIQTLKNINIQRVLHNFILCLYFLRSSPYCLLHLQNLIQEVPGRPSVLVVLELVLVLPSMICGTERVAQSYLGIQSLFLAYRIEPV